MGKQHRSFKKDIDLLSEAYGAMMGGAHMSMGGLAQQAADHMAEEDAEHDKTGKLSDADLLKKVEGMGTAGDRLIDAAKERLKKEGSLTDHERDALARDAYGAAERKLAKDHEDAEGHHEDESYEQKMNKMGAAHGFTGSGKGHATD
tara:strand:- start:2878 stop:3318 length:441 start_codon:yes stop_codon:yes gene_type:complete